MTYSKINVPEEFKDYYNPRKAEQIWKEYEKDVKALGVWDRAVLIRESTKSANNLDIRLAKMFDKVERSTRRHV